MSAIPGKATEYTAPPHRPRADGRDPVPGWSHLPGMEAARSIVRKRPGILTPAVVPAAAGDSGLRLSRHRLCRECGQAGGGQGRQDAPGDASHGRLATPVGRERYAQRKWLCEAPNGRLREVLGFRRFSVRGLNKARGENNPAEAGVVEGSSQKLSWQLAVTRTSSCPLPYQCMLPFTLNSLCSFGVYCSLLSSYLFQGELSMVTGPKAVSAESPMNLSTCQLHKISTHTCVRCTKHGVFRQKQRVAQVHCQ